MAKRHQGRVCRGETTRASHICRTSCIGIFRFLSYFHIQPSFFFFFFFQITHQVEEVLELARKVAIGSISVTPN